MNEHIIPLLIGFCIGGGLVSLSVLCLSDKLAGDLGKLSQEARKLELELKVQKLKAELSCYEQAPK